MGCLRGCGLEVRVLTGNRRRADRLGTDVEVVDGNVADMAAVRRAVEQRGPWFRRSIASPDPAHLTRHGQRSQDAGARCRGVA